MGSVTPFQTIYDSFFNRVTDTMYMELTELDTQQILQDLLINAIPRFEFPRFDIYDYTLGEKKVTNIPNQVQPLVQWIGGCFNSELTQEEINILSLCMVIEWFGQQLAIVDNTQLRFTGADFKMTSQANHMSKLKVMINQYNEDSIHLQHLYRRRKFKNGKVVPTARIIMLEEDDDED